MMTNIFKIFLAFCIIGFMSALFAYNIEPYKLVVNSSDLFIPNWNEKLNGLKVGIVSDLHIGSKNVDLKDLELIVEKINNQNPDVIFLLGDFDSRLIANSNISKKEISKFLNQFNAKYGIYAILGNHDYEPSNVIKPILNNTKIKLLEDESIFLSHNNVKIRICGTKDWWHYDVDTKKLLGVINEPTILLSHNPDIFPEVPSKVALTLCGHTHGGEVSFPILGSPFVPSVYSNKYSKGHIIENNKHMFVTSGIGTLSRFRLFNPPEIVILNLYSQDKTLESKNKLGKGFCDNFVKFRKKKYKKLCSIKQ